MRERARSVGGTVDAGPVEDGWMVSAELPPLNDDRGCGHVIRVVLVDDQDLVRAGLERILGTEDDLSIVAQCADGAQALDAIDDPPARCRRDGHPDAVMNGIEATRRIRDADGPPVLILTTFDDDETLWGAIDAGAAGFVLKDAAATDLIRAVRTVASGAAWLDPQVTPRVLAIYRTTVLPQARQQDARRRADRPRARRVAIDRRGRDERRDRRLGSMSVAAP